MSDATTPCAVRRAHGFAHALLAGASAACLLGAASIAHAQVVGEDSAIDPNEPSVFEQATEIPEAPNQSTDDRDFNDGQVDTIVVTGSIVRSNNQDFQSPSPIQTVSQLDIANTGAQRLQDLFKGLTVNSGSQIANRQNALQGVSQFSLRGLGIGSTLTLVNGRRAGLSPVTDATGQLFTDANAYPVNMIERIDVLTDGASATYGSEAVAGVVNVITRQNFEGLEFTGEARTSEVDSLQFGIAAGTSFDRGHFQIFGNYFTQDGAFRSDLGFIRDRDADNARDGVDIGGVFSSGTGAPGRFTGAIPNPDGAGFVRTGNTLADPDCVAAGGILRSESSCRYPFIDQRRIIAEEDRLQLFSQFDYEISERIDLFAEASYSRNTIRDGAGGLVLRRTTNDGGFFVGADNPFNFFVSDGNGGITYAGPEAFAADPTLQAVDLIYRGRPLGRAFDGNCEGDDDLFCAEEIDTTFDNFRLAGGLDIELGNDWFFNTSYVYSENEYDRIQPRDYSAEAFQQAINDGVFNPFGLAIVNPTGVSPRDGVSTFGNTQADIDTFALDVTEAGRVTQKVAEGIVSGGTGFELDGGEISVALGAQYRELGFSFTPDGRRQDGTNARAEVDGPVEFTTQDVYAIFGEALVPVTEDLEVQLALRYEDYGDQGGDTWDPKISAKWDITEIFALRGSYGTSFQAPSIRQVSGAVGNAGVQDPRDPAAGNFNVTVLTSGAPDLSSQSAENLNIGAIADTGTFRAAVDVWRYDYQDLILPGGSPQAIINDVEAGLLPAEFVVRDASGQLNQVLTGFENRGDTVAEGFDVNLAYAPQWGFLDGHRLVIDGAATIITKFRSDEFEGLDSEGDLRGSRNDGNAFGSAPDVKINLGATYTRDIHQFNITGRYIGEYQDDQPTPPADIDDQITVDARYSVQLEDLVGFGEGTSLTVGAVNLFDVDPPEIGPRPLFDTEVADPRGRQLYVGFRQRF